MSTYVKLFIIMNNKLKINLIKAGLNGFEAEIYINLLRNNGMTKLQLSRATDINRSKIYRLVQDMIQKGIIYEGVDDRGKFVYANTPDSLKLDIVSRFEKLEDQKIAIDKVLPELSSLMSADNSPLNFKINTYEGEDGFKQMLWNELKAKGKVLILGSGEMEDLVEDRSWCEKHRAMTVESGYEVNEILNSDDKRYIHAIGNKDFTDLESFKEVYSKKYLESSILNLKHLVVIYNDTVSTYCYRDGQKVGFEVINRTHAGMYRQIFARYWAEAKDIS